MPGFLSFVLGLMLGLLAGAVIVLRRFAPDGESTLDTVLALIRGIFSGGGPGPRK